MLDKLEDQSEEPFEISDKDYTEDNKTVNRVMKFTFIGKNTNN